MSDHEIKRTSFDVSAYDGQWREGTVTALEWREVGTRKDGTDYTEHHWHIEGFPEKADQTFGSEYEVQVEVYRGLDRKRYLVAMGLPDHFDFVVCSHIGAMLSVVNQMLPLVTESRATAKQAVHDEHYMKDHAKKHLRNGELNEDCEVCREAWERWACSPER